MFSCFIFTPKLQLICLKKNHPSLRCQDKEQAYKEFLAGNPSLEDFENELKRYMNLEIEIGQITSSYTIGSLSLQTTHLKTALKKEAMEWKAQYAKNLHIQARSNLENILFEMVCG